VLFGWLRGGRRVSNLSDMGGIKTAPAFPGDPVSYVEPSQVVADTP